MGNTLYPYISLIIVLNKISNKDRKLNLEYHNQISTYIEICRQHSEFEGPEVLVLVLGWNWCRLSSYGLFQYMYFFLLIFSLRYKVIFFSVDCFCLEDIDFDSNFFCHLLFACSLSFLKKAREK